jgi:DNA invertase Pin-like site-specific DNA recombinase
MADEEHIYVDDGISGAEFVKRPGFLRLMNALKPRPPFQVLIMSEESRLGREQIETAYALKQIMDAGVRVFFYLEDRERSLDTAMDKVMLSLAGFAAEMEREKARQRTYDAMRRKAQALQVTGGSVYGYDNHNLAVLSPTPGPDGRCKRLHVVRKINPDQASVVRRIFEMYARQGPERRARAAAPPRRQRVGAFSGPRDRVEPESEGHPRRDEEAATAAREGLAPSGRSRVAHHPRRPLAGRPRALGARREHIRPRSRWPSPGPPVSPRHRLALLADRYGPMRRMWRRVGDSRTATSVGSRSRPETRVWTRTFSPAVPRCSLSRSASKRG